MAACTWASARCPRASDAVGRTPQGEPSRDPNRITGSPVSPVKTITRSPGTRLAAPGGVPYNTAPAGGLAARTAGEPLFRRLYKGPPLTSTVEQQGKAIVAEQLGVKQEQVTNDASVVRDPGAALPAPVE